MGRHVHAAPGHASPTSRARLRRRVELEEVGSLAREQLRLRPRKHRGSTAVERPPQGAAAHQPAGRDAPERVPRPRHPAARQLRAPVGAGEGVSLTLDTATRAAAAPARRRRRRPALATPALLGLPVSWLIVFFVVPIAIVGAYSVDVFVLFPGPHSFTLTPWRSFFSQGTYFPLFVKSVEMSLAVSAVVVAVAYPLAYYLALSGTRRKYVLLPV